MTLRTQTQIKGEYSNGNTAASMMASNAIQRAKKRGLLHASHAELKAEINRQLMANDYRCPIFGTKFERNTSSRGAGDTSPTLDKIIPSKGYVLGNLQVISAKANRIKNDATPEELMLVAQHSMRMIAN